MNGHGIYKMNNGKILEGNFQNNLLCGQGKMTWPKAEKVYEGTFTKGSRSGFGTMKFKDGGIYRGQW